jgi:hypothetical protein
VNVVKTGSIQQSWVSIFSDLRNKRVFPVMSSKGTDQKNQSSLELIKLELMTATNYDYSSKEFFKFAQEDKRMFSSAALVDKYI